jgi:putative endonuclease
MNASAFLSRLFLPSRFTPAEIGRLGERRARWIYRLRGYSIVASNVRFPSGEIDLIARRFGTLVFVEVKTRQQRERGAPHEAVTRKKQLQVASLAQRWLQSSKFTYRTIRFDVVSLYWTGRRFEIERFEEAYQLLADSEKPWKWR